MLRNLYILFIVPVLLVFTGCSRVQKTAEQEETNPNIVQLSAEQMKQITLDTAKLEEERTDIILSGKVSFDKDYLSQVYSLVGGNVLKVNVSLGDYVKKGQVLAVLRSGDISDYEGQYDIAQAQLRTAKRNLDIAQQLYKTNVYSDKEVMQAQNDYKAAQDNLNKVATYLKTFGVSDTDRNSEYRIVSPIDGYIVTKAINAGTNIRSDNTNALFTVSSLQTVWVEANIYENDIPKVNENDPVKIVAVAYPAKPFTGVIAKIGNVLDSTASTLEARIVLDNPDGILKPGMFTTVTVHVDKHRQAIAVPRNALVFNDNAFYVMVYLGHNTFARRRVEPEGNNEYVSYLREGLKAGEIVVNKGSLYVLGQ